MFQFTWFASMTYFTQSKIIGIASYRVSSFRHLRVKACLAALRSLSWPTPSFIGSMSQGIRLVPWVVYHSIFYIVWIFDLVPFLAHSIKNERFYRTFVSIHLTRSPPCGFIQVKRPMESSSIDFIFLHRNSIINSIMLTLFSAAITSHRTSVRHIW